MMELIMSATRSNHDASRRGAKDHKVSIANRWRAYISHHKETSRSSLTKMIDEPLQTILTLMVIAIALALPSSLFVVLSNAEQLGGSFESSSQITVFVKQSADEAKIIKLTEILKELPDIKDVSLISAEAGLEEFTLQSGFGEALRHLDENPLPAVLIVQPADSSDAMILQQLSETIVELENVDDVQFDMLWIKRLIAISKVGQKLVLAVGVTLVIGVILVIGNTIRLAIQNRREEIVVVKLVGGTDAYVRRPFLYTGLFLGFFGALLAAILVLAGIIWVDQSVSVVSELYQSTFQLKGLGFFEVFVLCGGGALIGLLGAWVAVMQHLRAVEPK